MKTHIIYHDHCMDGFGAAFIAGKVCVNNKDTVSFVPASCGQDIDDLIGDALKKEDKVYILDFSFSPECILDLCRRCKSVIWLDHHKTAMDTWAQYWNDKDETEYPDNLTVDLDIERSGAGITWDYFGLKNPRPRWVEYIEDRDLWKFQYGSNTKAFHAWLASYDKHIGTWQSRLDYFSEYPGMCLDQGYSIIRAHDKTVESICENAIPITINGQKGLVANCTRQFASDVGHALAINSTTFGATWYQDKSGNINWSLRSVDSFDVAAIARSFGGGGHKNAAGFVTAYPAIKSTYGGELSLYSCDWQEVKE